MFFSLPTHLKKRQYLICDEAAELEGQLVKEFSCNVNFEFLKKMEIHIRPIYTKGDNIIKWINVLVLELKEKMDWLQDAITGAKGKKYLLEKKSELIGLSNLHSKLSLIIDSWQDSEYIYDKDAKGITFMPLKVDKLSNHLFKYADKVILMSATIIDPSNFCKNLGIEEFKYVEAESSFNPDNAPIFCNTKVKLNYYNMGKNLPKIAKQVEEICNFHKDEKGIIHTQNNNITSYMAGKLLGERYLIREPGVRNEDILDQHMASDEPTVLISPSLSHGVDLKDDLARFQIIIKAPFLPTRDKRIEKMMKGDFVWYENKMLCSLIQACGRGVRSQKDHCTTYILDAAVVESVIKNKYKLPKYFLDRFC
jgi:Rad3-related DNA helicase